MYTYLCFQLKILDQPLILEIVHESPFLMRTLTAWQVTNDDKEIVFGLY